MPLLEVKNLTVAFDTSIGLFHAVKGIDLHVDVPRLPQRDLLASTAEAESSRVVRDRVVSARQRQHARSGTRNARLSPAQLRRFVGPDAEGAQLLEHAACRLSLSARACHRILRVARTIADLAGDDGVHTHHLAEAISYRTQQAAG